MCVTRLHSVFPSLTMTVPSTCEEKREEGRDQTSSWRAVLIVSYSWLPCPCSIARKIEEFWTHEKSIFRLRHPARELFEEETVALPHKK